MNALVHPGRRSTRFVPLALLCVALLATCWPVSPCSAIQVHLIPHSHQDPGYRETVYGYWRDKVSHTLRTTVEALKADPRRRFVWEETVWLRYLWESGDNATINGFMELVANQQIEIIGGGWVMHDEADTSLWATANQMTIGLDFLHRNLKARPKWAWHIDPFGHSVTSPSVFASLGYSAFVVNRIPDSEKQQRKAAQNMEFVWTGSSAQHPDSMLLGHVLDSHYSTPVFKGDTAAARAKALAEECAKRAQWYRTEHVLVPFGNDFAFTMAELQFKQMDAIIGIINEDPASHNNVTIRYSTLDEYFTALHSDPDAIFPVAQTGKDFFPYIACSPCEASMCANVPCGSHDAYWVGYYSSLGYQKHAAFRLDALARSLNIMDTLHHAVKPTTNNSNNNNNNDDDNNSGVVAADRDLILTTARNTSALMQHHDAMPGTSFNYCSISKTQCDCVADYNHRIASTANSSDHLLGKLKAEILGMPENVSVVTLATLATSSYSSPQWTLLISNPVAWERREIVRISVAGVTTSRVVDVSTGQAVPSQVVVDQFRGTNVVFIAVRLPPLAVATYRLDLGVVAPDREPPSEENNNSSKNNNDDDDDDGSSSKPASMCNGAVCLEFSGSTGRPSAWVDVASGTRYAFNIDHVYMRERTPTNSNIFSGSNVYAFTPKGSRQSWWPAKPTLTTVAQGPLVWETTAQLSANRFVTFRLLNASLVGERRRALEVQTHTGEMPRTESGSLLMRVSTNVSSGHAFYTDNNAFQRTRRVFNSSRPYSGNFYPLVGAAVIEAESHAMALSAARPLAVTSPSSGALEVMLHRRIMDSDHRGNDSSVMDDVVLVSLGAASITRFRAAKVSTLQLYPLDIHAVAGREEGEVSVLVPMKVALPDGVHLLDLRRRDGSAGYGMWMQGLTGLEGGRVDLGSVVDVLKGVAWKQTSLDFRLSINETRRARLNWRQQNTAPQAEWNTREHGHAENDDPVLGGNGFDIKPESLVAFAG